MGSEPNDPSVADEAVCPICIGHMLPVRWALVLGQHQARYEQCPRCGYLRISSPFWIHEAYANPIADADVGLVARNLHIAQQLTAVCPLLSQGNGPYLDYGGGYGLLVRLMRDRGFDFWWLDAYSTNLLAGGCDYQPSIGPCVAVTAFEVLEHVVKPVEFVENALIAGQSDTFIFSTELFGSAPPPADWWYYAPESGQHISFYRLDTLQTMAAQLGMNFMSAFGIHVFSRKTLPVKRLRRALSRRGRALALLRNRRRPSLLDSDSNRMVAKLRAFQRGSGGVIH